MRRLLILLLCALLLGALGGFIYWSKLRPSSLYLSDLRSQIHSDARPEQVQGNILLLRPQLYPLDYQSPAHLRLILSAALEHAKREHLLNEQTLVVLPEHIGTWLLGSHEKDQFYRARSRQEVRDWLLLGNPVLAAKALLNNLDAERLDEALLRMKARRMAHDYQQLFGELAASYGIHLLAGSILLPSPQIINGELQTGDGALENISLLFSPHGIVEDATYRETWPWQPTAHDQRFRHAGIELTIQRTWLDYYPQSRVSFQQTVSPPLFLRGRLSWPIGGASREIKLTPHTAEQLSSQPGTHLINLWLTP